MIRLLASSLRLRRDYFETQQDGVERNKLRRWVHKKSVGSAVHEGIEGALDSLE